MTSGQDHVAISWWSEGIPHLEGYRPRTCSFLRGARQGPDTTVQPKQPRTSIDIIFRRQTAAWAIMGTEVAGSSVIRRPAAQNFNRRRLLRQGRRIINNNRANRQVYSRNP